MSSLSSISSLSLLLRSSIFCLESSVAFSKTLFYWKMRLGAFKKNHYFSLQFLDFSSFVLGFFFELQPQSMDLLFVFRGRVFQKDIKLFRNFSLFGLFLGLGLGLSLRFSLFLSLFSFSFSFLLAFLGFPETRKDVRRKKEIRYLYPLDCL